MIDYILFMIFGFVFGYVGVMIVAMIIKNEMIFYLYQEENILLSFYIFLVLISKRGGLILTSIFVKILCYKQ